MKIDKVLVSKEISHFSDYRSEIAGPMFHLDVMTKKVADFHNIVTITESQNLLLGSVIHIFWSV